MYTRKTTNDTENTHSWNTSPPAILFFQVPTSDPAANGNRGRTIDKAFESKTEHKNTSTPPASLRLSSSTGHGGNPRRPPFGRLRRPAASNPPNLMCHAGPLPSQPVPSRSAVRPGGGHGGARGGRGRRHEHRQPVPLLRPQRRQVEWVVLRMLSGLFNLRTLPISGFVICRLTAVRVLALCSAIRCAWEDAAGNQHAAVREHIRGGRPHQPHAIVMLQVTFVPSYRIVLGSVLMRFQLPYSRYVFNLVKCLACSCAFLVCVSILISHRLLSFFWMLHLDPNS